LAEKKIRAFQLGTEELDPALMRRLSQSLPVLRAFGREGGLCPPSDSSLKEKYPLYF